VRYPKLYIPGHYDALFNKRVFARSVAEGIVSSLVLFFVPYCAFYDAVKPDGLDIAGHKAFGCVVASALIVTVTLRVMYFPFSASTLLVGRQEGHPACKKLGVGLLVVTI